MKGTGNFRLGYFNFWRKRPLKYLTSSRVGLDGRSTMTGRICIFGRGGSGVKRRLRVVDFRRVLYDVDAKVIRLEFDPSRTAPIALCRYSNGVLTYILACYNFNYDMKLRSHSGVPLSFQSGDVAKLNVLFPSAVIHNLEDVSGQGFKYARAGGCYARVARFSEDRSTCTVVLPSGRFRLFSVFCRATLGRIALPFRTHPYRKAGVSRRLGRKPKVRGVAMNPVDHPHGGGEGKTSGGRCSVTPWGKLTKGKKTRLKIGANRRSLV